MDTYWTKGPGETLDFTADLTADLEAETISTVTWQVSPLTEVSKDHSGATASVRLSGGVEGTAYPLLLTVVTSSGNTVVRNLWLIVRSR